MASAHNLKAAGSNPAPATKIPKHINGLNVECFTCVRRMPFYINATSTFDESPLGNRVRLQSLVAGKQWRAGLRIVANCPRPASLTSGIDAVGGGHVTKAILA
jgi:hypothetical protein